MYDAITRRFYTRSLHQDDWRIFRQIRLESLALEANRFGCSLSVEQNYNEQDWRTWLSAEDKHIHGLFDNQNLIGIIGSVTWKPNLIEITEACNWSEDEQQNSAFCIAAYIKQEYRRHGLVRRLLEDGLHWLINQADYIQIIVAHRTSNSLIRRFVQAYGLNQIERRPYTWPHKICEDILIHKGYLNDIKVYLTRATSTFTPEPISEETKET